jgi:hypothetical protein
VGKREASRERSRRESGWERERQVVKDQEGRASGKERGLRGTKAGFVERAACPIHVPGEEISAPVEMLKAQSDTSKIRFSMFGITSHSVALALYVELTCVFQPVESWIRIRLAPLIFFWPTACVCEGRRINRRE